MNKKTLPWVSLITINLFWLGLNLRTNAVGVIVMPYLVDRFVEILPLINDVRERNLNT